MAMRLIMAAWFAFVASFFLPATNVVERAGTAPGTPISGWCAFQTPIEVIFSHPLIILAEPKMLLFLAVPLINLMILAAPLMALLMREYAHLLGLFFIPAALFPFFLPKTVTGDLYIGFYLWILSFVVMTIGCIWLGISSLLRDQSADCP